MSAKTSAALLFFLTPKSSCFVLNSGETEANSAATTVGSKIGLFLNAFDTSLAKILGAPSKSESSSASRNRLEALSKFRIFCLIGPKSDSRSLDTSDK